MLHVSRSDSAHWKAIALVAVRQDNDVLFDAWQRRDIRRLVYRPVGDHLCYQ